jgi:plastocyanin
VERISITTRAVADGAVTRNEADMVLRRPITRAAGLAGVSLLTLALAGCSGDAGSTATSPPVATASPDPTIDAGPTSASGHCTSTDGSGTVEITMEGRTFSVGRIEASPGDIITFTNRDSVPHTATLDDGTCTTDSLGKGAAGSLVFDAPGSYPFHCRIHPDMTGTFEISG